MKGIRLYIKILICSAITEKNPTGKWKYYGEKMKCRICLQIRYYKIKQYC